MFVLRGRNSLQKTKQPAQVRGRNSPEAETACHTQADAGRLSLGPHGGGKGARAGSVEDNARLEARATAGGL